MLDVNFGDINARAAARLGSRNKQVGMWRRFLRRYIYWSYWWFMSQELGADVKFELNPHLIL